MPSQLRTWLQLLRAPNLFTVPGDPLAGYLLACYGEVDKNCFVPIAASLCFYSSGLLLNDLADLKEDRIERPKRPLPAGAASLPIVGLVMMVLALAGLGLCASLGVWTFGVGLALVLCIASYNLGLKRVPGLGALNMGLCRGLSLLLGATAVPHGDLTIGLLLARRLNHLFVAFLLVTLFIAAVTNLARFETKSLTPAYAKWLPAVVVAACALSFIPMVNGPNRISISAFLSLAFLIALQAAWKLASNPQHAIPPLIGQLIRSLLIIQAAFCAALGDIAGSFAAAVLLTLWPISRAVGKVFYAS